MARDPRNRNARHLASADTGPIQWEWANIAYDLTGFSEDECCECDLGEGRRHVHKDQVAFNYGPSPLCLSGGFGSAKTYVLSRKVLFLSTLFPHNRIVIARKVGKELRLSTQSTFFKICPPQLYDQGDGGRRSDTENYLRLADRYGGSEILWMHLEDDEIMGVLRGLEINAFLLDQAEEISEEVYDTLMARLGRWDKAEVTPHALQMLGATAETWPYKSPNGRLLVPTYPMLACNPDTELHWIYRRFHPDSPEHNEAKMQELSPQTGEPTGRLVSYRDLGYRMISLSSLENRFLPVQARQNVLSLDETARRRLVYGLWGIPEGQIHQIPPESLIPGSTDIVRKVLHECALSRSMDHGDAAPTAVGWWGVFESGDVIHFAEYYKPNLYVSQHRRNIKEIDRLLCQIAGIPEIHYQQQLADPSIFNPVQQKNRRSSVADDWQDQSGSHGFERDNAIFWERGNHDEFGTRNIINEYLRVQGTGQKWTKPEPPEGLSPEHFRRWQETGEEPRMHPILRVLGYWPRLFFLKRSPQWVAGADRAIIETQSQRREKIGTELGKPQFSDDRDETITDHAYDMVRYFMASRAAAPQAQAQRYSKNSFYGARDEYLKFKRSGGWRLLQERIRANS